MQLTQLGPMKCHAEIERWPLVAPFRIAGLTWEVIDVVTVVLEKDGMIGRGEAAGVHYRNETAASMMKQIDSLRHTIEAGISRASLRGELPPGGARNSIDCALWDLEAKLTGRSAWQIAGLNSPRPLPTVLTCGADEPDKMAAAARSYANAKSIKIKLTGEPIDAERVYAVRQARPDVWLSVDANQGFIGATLAKLMPVLVEARVALIEQPFPIGHEALLDGLRSSIPIAADESVQSRGELPALVGRFNVVNIKLDKCGGLTEALEMARAAHALGFETWVGNMIGTSLAMAPAFLLGQLCNYVELDGPIFLQNDRPHPVTYADGVISCPEQLWGNSRP
jgi:L-Ala-D/L-Glu epimerase